MASAEGGSVPSGVRYGEGVSPLQPTKGFGERRELPQRGPGQSPGRKRILAFLKATERSFLYLYDKIWGEQFALASPAPNSGGGTCLPCPP